MNLLFGTLLTTFPLSLALNLLQFQLARKARLKRPESYELREFIRDMSAGRGLIEVRRVDPANVMLRSPRDIT
jgi:hypothetical protein